MKHSIVSSLKLGTNIKRHSIKISLNKQNKNICKYLFKIGFINSYVYNSIHNNIRIYFTNYYEQRPIKVIKQISKPGRKIYITSSKLKDLFRDEQNYLILSTSKGILTNKEAIRKKIGGELLFLIKC